MLKALNESILVSLSDIVILVFVIGHVVQEFLAFWREGCFIYFSKWWNVVDTMIILLFGFAYATWGISYAYFGWQWKPEKTAFITADVLFSSGIILAFFHLTHLFQVGAQTKGVYLLSFNSDGDHAFFFLFHFNHFFSLFTKPTTQRLDIMKCQYITLTQY